MPASDCTPQPNARSTPKEEYIVSVDGESVFVLWSANRSIICEVLTGDTKTARRERAEVIAASFNNAIEYPWTDDGPSVEEAGDRLILGRFGATLFPGQYLSDHRGRCGHWLFAGVDEDERPTGWRRMPKV